MTSALTQDRSGISSLTEGCSVLLPNGSRLSCSALVKNQIPPTCAVSLKRLLDSADRAKTVEEKSKGDSAQQTSNGGLTISMHYPFDGGRHTSNRRKWEAGSHRERDRGQKEGA